MNPYLITAVISYLLGAIPFGYLLVRLFKGEDVRSSGSGNIGATNVARKSPALGVATLLLDAVKGLAAVLLARALFSGSHQPLIMTTAAFFAVLGHLFPVWLKFRGGKGVATSLGSFILLTPKSILCMLILFLFITVAFRYVSLGSIAAATGFSAGGVGSPRIYRLAADHLYRRSFGAGDLEAPAKYRSPRRRNRVTVRERRSQKRYEQAKDEPHRRHRSRRVGHRPGNRPRAQGHS